MALYRLEAHPFAYAEGYTLNLDLASALARLHFSGEVGIFFSSNGMKKCVTELIVPSIIWLGESVLLNHLRRSSFK